MNHLIPHRVCITLRFIGINHGWGLKLLFFVCLLQISFSVQAGPANEKQILQLETSLLRIHQNQQNIFQQFQMIQELRRYELKQEEDITSLPPTGAYPQMGENPMISEFLPGINIEGSPPSYEEMTKKMKERQKRIQQYTSDLDRLHARYQELENEKVLLMEQLSELTKGKKEELTE